MSKIMLNSHLVWVVYDGVANSVFTSQVLQPAMTLVDTGRHQQVTIVSFEPFVAQANAICSVLPSHPRVRIIVQPRWRLPLRYALVPCVRALVRILSTLGAHIQLKARGPFAGYIVLSARARMQTAQRLPCTIQVRGLCVQEYLFTYAQTQTHGWFDCLRFAFTQRMLRYIEHYVYGMQRAVRDAGPYALEVVSQALKIYLIDHFRTPAAAITLAADDLPLVTDGATRIVWRLQIRQELNIPKSAKVYCYSGSYKPWQCAAQTVAWAAQQLANQDDAFLLVLSTDVSVFAREIEAQKIPQQRVRVLQVKPDQLPRYLAAADVGILFRKSDIVNWTARPTKMLEYRAAGLQIVHNNTVAALIE